MAKHSLLKLVTGAYDEEPEKLSIKDENVPAASSAADKQESWMENEGQLTIDVYQLEDEMVIKSTVAGVKNEDLDITITSDMVTIRGAREREEEIHPQDYYYQELYWGPFSRSVVLPYEIDTESAKAALRDGVLTIRLPKLERSKTKKLKIQGA